MKHLDVRHCWLQPELRNRNYKVKRIDDKFNASDMLTHITVPPQMERQLQCSQHDAGSDVCSKDYSILCEHGGDVEFVSYSSESFRCC